MSQTKAQLLDPVDLTIVTDDIANGAITNAKVNASAAIARTKLANVDLVDDTSPQLGGTLDTNGNLITFGDSSGASDDRLKFGVGADLSIFHNGTNSFMENSTGILAIRSDSFQITDKSNNHAMITATADGAVELYHDNGKKFFTITNGVQATNRIIVGEGTAQRGLISGDANSVSVGSISDIPLNFTRNSLLKARIDGNDFQIPNDNGKIELGASQDLQLYHNGTDSIIEHTTAGSDLIIQTTGSGDDVFIKCSDDFIVNVVNGTENAIIARNDGEVELYHNGSKKFETYQYGIRTTQNIDIGTHAYWGDNGEANFGASQDLQIFHNGTDSYIQNATNDLFILSNGDDLILRANDDVFIQPQNGENGLTVRGDGSVELYYNNSQKLHTTSSGINVTGQADVDSINCTGELDLVGHLDLNSDSHRIKLGAGDDFQLWHDGSNNYIYTNNGDITIQTGGDDIQLLAHDDIILKVQGGAETAINCVGNGGVELYWNNTLRFSTHSTGVSLRGSDQFCEGHFYPWTNNTYDLGSTSYRWRNIYTNDLNLSNEGSSNDVDGTWGDWTIQEGESDLFLKNNRSGKKYKFNLMEVS